MRKLRVVLRKRGKTTCSFIYGHGAFLRVNKAKSKFKYIEPWGNQNIAKKGKLTLKA